MFKVIDDSNDCTYVLKSCSIFLYPHNKMINGSSNVAVDCFECDNMKQLTEVDWYTGLFVKVISLATLAVLTTIVNVFLMYIVCQTKSMVANTNVFFISLCVAHLLGSTAVIPLWIITRLSPEIAENSPIFCQMASFIWILMILASFYSLSALSLDRYLIIFNPLRYQVTASKYKKNVVASVLWILCIFIAAAPIVGWGEYTFQPHSIPICGLNMKYSQSFTITLIVLGFGAPLIVDIFCCAQIISIARGQSRSIGSRRSLSSSIRSNSSTYSGSSTTTMHPVYKMSKLKQKLNSLRLIFAGTGSFLVCWLPYIGVHVWMSSGGSVNNVQESMPYIMEFVVMCIALLNGLLNPVVIMFSNRDYMKEIRRLFMRNFRKSYVYDINEIDTSSTRSRRSQFNPSNVSNTCRTIPEVHLDINPHEHACLKKQDSDRTPESLPDLSWPTTTVLDVNRIQLSVVNNLHEIRRLTSRSSAGSLEFDTQLEHVSVGCYMYKSIDIHPDLTTQKFMKIDIELSNVVIK